MSKRLTDKQRAEVVTDYASGKTKSEIARKFKVSPNAISKILNKFKSSREEDKGSGEVQKPVYGVVLLDVNINKDNFEIVHCHWVKEKNLKTLK